MLRCAREWQEEEELGEKEVRWGVRGEEHCTWLCLVWDKWREVEKVIYVNPPLVSSRRSRSATNVGEVVTGGWV